MPVNTHDIEAEEIIVRAMIHNVCFDEIFHEIEPHMMSSAVVGVDSRPVMLAYLFNTTVVLKNALRAVPTPDSIKNEVAAGHPQNIDPQMAVAYFDKLRNRPMPLVADIRSAINRLMDAYYNRYVANALRESLEMLDGQGGFKTMEFLRKSIAKGTKLRKEDAVIVDYVTEYTSRREQVINTMQGLDGGIKRLSFGITKMDEITGGMGPGELIVGVAATGRGKTVFMNDACAHVIESGQSAIFFTKEMIDTEIGFRFDSRFSNIKHPKFADATLTNEDFQIWDTKVKSLKENSLKIVVMNREFTTERMRYVLDSLDWVFKPDVIFTDYVNLMHPSKRDSGSPLWNDTSVVCEELKDLARDMKIPIVTMAQLKPQSSEKTDITFDDIAVSKLGLTAHANMVFGILSDMYLKAIGQAIIQFLKVRNKGTSENKIRIYPDMDSIRIHSQSSVAIAPVQPQQTRGVVYVGPRPATHQQA